MASSYRKIVLSALLSVCVWTTWANANWHDLINSNNQSGMCRAPTTAPPCAQGGVAGLASPEPTLNMGVGNPVHLATGAKQQIEVDLPARVNAPDFELIRYYNSLDSHDSPLGIGWRWSYDTRVIVDARTPSIEQANGERLRFDAQTDPNVTGVLQRQGRGWRWIWPDGRRLEFDAQGYLIRIQTDPKATAIDIVRHRDALAPAIAQVRSGGQVLRFSYTVIDAQARLTQITGPAGTFTYTHEAIPNPDAASLTAFSRRLTSMTRPDGMQRQYLYEAAYQSGNASLITGIVLYQPDVGANYPAQSLRLSAWDYDSYGRAIGVALGERTAAHGYSRIRYRHTTTPTRDGLTLVHSPAGETRFRFALRAGQYRLLSVEGAACPGCAAPGTHASYDAQGRLQTLNKTRLERDTHGYINGIVPQAPGWPGLHLRFTTSGARRQWESTLTGLERVQNHATSQSTTRQFANGDAMNIRYDAQGLPARVLETRQSKDDVASTDDALTTRLHWHHGQLQCLQHPHATERRRTNGSGALVQRTEMRRLSTTPAAASKPPLPCVDANASRAHSTAPDLFHITEHFQYDAQGRLMQHQLPEGGALHYVWGKHQRLQAITWEDASGARHPVISTVPTRAGYRYGNGLHLRAAHDGQRRMTLTLADTQGARWQQTRVQNAQGHVLQETYHMRRDTPLSGFADATTTAPHAPPAWQTLEDWRYAYDAKDRLTGAHDQLETTQQWFAWKPDGSLAARAMFTADTAITALPVTSKPAIARDASGLPTTVDDLRLSYGANRRLIAVQRHGKVLARHAHNAYGHRIRTQTPFASTDYLYLNQRLVAETQAWQPGEQPWITRRYIYAHHVPVGMVVYTSATDIGTLYAIHADLLGAPRVITDARGTVRWLARYTPLGGATQIAGDLSLHLRLPGQWLDPATGLYDNGLRTYAPQWGQYLEPDPLGPVPGNQALGYAAQQPRRFVDPMGLLLFAFDGTRHNHRTNSNVMKLLRQYQDGPAYYHAGPGNAYDLDWDAVTAHSAPRILETQWFNLLVALKQANSLSGVRTTNGSVPIDIIGFSRGAALARHFGNLIANQTTNGLFSYRHADLGLISTCVDLRFMGLMDTVAQFGLNGQSNRQYDFSITEAWAWVAHAVALHEHQVLFPLSSTRNTHNTNVIEAPFIGAHGDIGGGNLLDPTSIPRQGDLSDVALNWLWWQAQHVAGVSMKALTQEQRAVQNPLMHDARPSVFRLLQAHEEVIAQAPAPLSYLLQLINLRGFNADHLFRQGAFRKALEDALPDSANRLQNLADRSLFDDNGAPLHTYQADDERLGTATRRNVEPFIRRVAQWQRSSDVVVGSVDMAGYVQWLERELGWGNQLEITAD